LVEDKLAMEQYSIDGVAMPDVVSVPPEAKPAPLFSLDLGASGGILTPRSADELSA